MNELVGWILLGLTVAWAVQAAYAAVAQFKLVDTVTHSQSKRYSGYRPKAALIVPFKGVEPALRSNLHGLFTQDYPDYHLLLIVEDEQDEAYPLLLEAIAEHPQRRATIITAGAAGPNEGQKVHNLIAAVEHLQQAQLGEEAWVFADSDAVPGPAWLGELVGPLCQDRTAVTTGFRWLVPVSKPGQTEVNFAAKIASILNSSTAALIRRERYTHAWGGSMAMRAATAQQADLIGHWRGAISDDYQVTRMARELGKRIYFVPECLVASPVDYDMSGLLDFAYRQYLITRIHAPLVFILAVLINALYFAGMTSAAVLLIAPNNAHERYIAIGAFLLVFTSNQVRATLRQKAVRVTLGPQVVKQLNPTFKLERWTTPLWLGINLLLLLRAAFGRTITWRSIRYRIKGPQNIQRL